MTQTATPKVAVIGLGFIGLPLSLSYAMHGANVVGLDVLPRHVDEINAGVTHHLEFYNGKSAAQILREQLDRGTFRATTSYADAAAAVDHYIITVGIPIRDGEPDLSYLTGCAQELAKVLKKGDTVIVRSTVVPGTTEQVVLPILEQGSNLKAGEDFFLAYSSERIAEGRAFEEFITMPLAVGGINPPSTERALNLLSFVTKAEMTVAAIQVVETSKVIENVQRDVNIAMVQEFARFAEKAGIDTFDLIKVANTHKRVSLLTPGPGVGGYCLPNALYYLLPAAEKHGVKLPLLETARRVNDAVPGVLVDLVEDMLKSQGKTLQNAKVSVLGLAMKDFSNDDRISPPHQICELFGDRGAIVRAFDPAVVGTYSYKVDSLDAAIDGADALVYLAVQEEFVGIDWPAAVAKMAPGVVLLDTKNRIPRDLPAGAKLIRI
jgi:UDP-N-acetyl-D-mannosaminuronic acid dehydrogenase